jgi:hypothetical protein
MKIAAVLIVALSFLPASSKAVEIVPPRQESRVAEVEWQKLSGRVEETDLINRTLHLRDKNGNLTRIQVDEKVEILRNFRLVALNDIRQKDRVVVRRTANGL